MSIYVYHLNAINFTFLFLLSLDNSSDRIDNDLDLKRHVEQGVYIHIENLIILSAFY